MEPASRPSSIGPSRVVSAVVGALVVLTAACGPRVKVSSNYDPDRDFFYVESFSWGGMHSNNMLPAFDVRRMELALQEELRLRGLLQRVKGDVVAVAYLGVGPSTQNALEYSHGLYWTETTKTVQLGTLVLDLVDPRTNRLIWRGIAQGQVQEGISVEKRERNIRDVARRLVSQYPPPDRR